jgi:tRNA pseudouridine38-40 synthase
MLNDIKNINIILEYDGSNYHGWQSQKNAVSVQDVVKKAIEKLTGESINLIGSSRTDQGVHALGMSANFKTSSKIPAEKFSYALNPLLPDDIVSKNSKEVSEDFHARFLAKGKHYRYLIYNSEFPSVIMRNRVYHVRKTLEFDNMKKYAKAFIGTHDFRAFQATGSALSTTIRTINSIELEMKDGIISIDICGDGFLYNMVRIIAGTLVEIGMNKINGEDIPLIIDSCKRERAGITAPACGLYLMEVYY